MKLIIEHSSFPINISHENLINERLVTPLTKYAGIDVCHMWEIRLHIDIENHSKKIFIVKASIHCPHWKILFAKSERTTLLSALTSLREELEPQLEREKAHLLQH